MDPKTLIEICRRFEQMAQPNSMSVVVLAETMSGEKIWHQPTLDFLTAKAKEEHSKGPNQMVMGWPSFFRHQAGTLLTS
ncbi:MAG TPA: hypothetical protein VFK94_04790 [Patescibacteria group bacterium]|nr:hypothetical protein [Patescibacteria group bacterium]